MMACIMQQESGGPIGCAMTRDMFAGLTVISTMSVPVVVVHSSHCIPCDKSEDSMGGQLRYCQL